MPDDIETYLLWSMAHYALGRIEEARSDGTQAVRLAPEKALIHDEHWLAFYIKGNLDWATAYYLWASEL